MTNSLITSALALLCLLPMSLALGDTTIGPAPGLEPDFTEEWIYPAQLKVQDVGNFRPDFTNPFRYVYEAFVPKDARSVTAYDRPTVLLFNFLAFFGGRGLIWFDVAQWDLLLRGYFAVHGDQIYTEDFTCFELPRLRKAGVPEAQRREIENIFVAKFGDWEKLFWELVEERYLHTRILREYYIYANELQEGGKDGDIATDFVVGERVEKFWNANKGKLRDDRVDMHKKFAKFIEERKASPRLVIDSEHAEESISDRLVRLGKKSGAENCVLMGD